MLRIFLNVLNIHNLEKIFMIKNSKKIYIFLPIINLVNLGLSFLIEHFLKLNNN